MTEKKVISIDGSPVIQASVDAGTVKYLERLLEMARSGEVVGIAFAATHADRATTVGNVGFYEARTCVGALEELKYDILRGGSA